jgi:hypothetical protein
MLTKLLTGGIGQTELLEDFKFALQVESGNRYDYGIVGRMWKEVSIKQSLGDFSQAQSWIDLATTMVSGLKDGFLKESAWGVGVHCRVAGELDLSGWNELAEKKWFDNSRLVQALCINERFDLLERMGELGVDFNRVDVSEFWGNPLFLKNMMKHGWCPFKENGAGWMVKTMATLKSQDVVTKEDMACVNMCDLLSAHYREGVGTAIKHIESLTGNDSKLLMDLIAKHEDLVMKTLLKWDKPHVKMFLEVVEQKTLIGNVYTPKSRKKLAL